MTLIKKSFFVVLGSFVAACDMPETATRNVPLSTSPLEIAETTAAPAYSFQSMSFSAPSDIVVSEGNGFYPNADVVWRGDPIGDRIAQIASIFETSFERAGGSLNGETPINVQVELVRFHGVTERTRFSVGGNYDMHFFMTVLHAETGEVLQERRFLQFDLGAPGGAAALLLEQSGQTEKVRVTDFLSQTLATELSRPIAL